MLDLLIAREAKQRKNAKANLANHRKKELQSRRREPEHATTNPGFSNGPLPPKLTARPDSVDGMSYQDDNHSTPALPRRPDPAPWQLPPFVRSVLALPLPIATSNWNNLAPSFKTLESIIDYIDRKKGIKGLPCGLWRVQIIRTTDRAAHLVQALWMPLCGKERLIAEEQDNDGQGVFRLQSVLSDIKAFVGSLTTLRNPLTKIIIDPEAFSRTQTAMSLLTKKLASLATYYKAVSLLPTPPDQWPHQDLVDQFQDLSDLPSFITNCTPSRAILQKFKANGHQLESASLSNPNPYPYNELTFLHHSTPATSAPTSSYFSTSVSSPAQHPEFLSFVYSQNPNLIAKRPNTVTTTTDPLLGNANQNPCDPKVNHLKVCGEYPIDLGDHTEGSTEGQLTRKQKRTRNNNKRKEKKRMTHLQQLIPTNEFSIHNQRANPQLTRLVQRNEVILRRKNVGGIVRFTPFSSLDDSLCDQFEKLSKHLINQSKYLYDNRNNHSTLGGKMFNVGWRKAYSHNEILGISAAVPKISGHEVEYRLLQNELKDMEQFLASRFSNISKSLYASLQSQHKNFNFPSISSDTFNHTYDFSFASHLSFTLKNFYNQPHCDRDSSTYTFGLWLPIDERDGSLIKNDLHVKGGNFLFPDDHFGLKFEGFNGVVEIIWKADELSHHTEISTSHSHHTRLGLSCEIPSTTLETLVRLQNNFYNNNGGLPVGSGSLAVSDLDPKSLDFCREI
ncbi:hypothetical protein PGTUg99_037679 [Puccinia graminis f. sp. tritici]|uniref:Tet-like 2OG-Fe(II) oxygenase domain-containing protein n=1 Tax=Puccinia graminis f. sp. tritici TaxID=56615 RepID=A0A5B0RAV4_PUCGR|nr:hypothetical protein PGTUg99_037679 [Puccinia graminis f. sp. tritici]